MDHRHDAQNSDDSQKHSLLFTRLVEMLAQNAVMLLGVPDRGGRALPPDLNGAEMIIEMLVVLKKRTQGNLSKDEDKILSNTLFQLQSAFADIASKSGDFSKARKAQEAVDTADLEEDSEEDFHPASSQAHPASSETDSHRSPPPSDIQPSSTQSHERKVKFTKKYN